MARQNRIVIESGYYHVTTRIAHKAFLLAPSEIKDKIVVWLYGIADFSGIDVIDWAILNNHIHILVHVPAVPERYRGLNSAYSQGTVPSKTTDAPLKPDGPIHFVPASAFSMRPPETRTPRWIVDHDDVAFARNTKRPIVISPAGDEPSAAAISVAHRDGVPVVLNPRPPVGFNLPDEEWSHRLSRLYAETNRSAARDLKRWKRISAAEREAEQENLCRRMYNISQFMQTLKLRISQYFTYNLNHSGNLWEGRFKSTIVEDHPDTIAVVAGYIGWNPVKAKLVQKPSDWKWCAYAVANGNGPYAERAQRSFANALSCPWEEAKERLDALFATRDAIAHASDDDPTGCIAAENDEALKTRAITIGELMKCSDKKFFQATFFGRNTYFARKAMASCHEKFPAKIPEKILTFLSKVDWAVPWAGNTTA